MQRKHTRKKYRAGQYDYRGCFCERVAIGTKKNGEPQMWWQTDVCPPDKPTRTIIRKELGALERRIDEILGE